MKLSQSFSNELLQCICGRKSTLSTSTVYLGLSFKDPSDNDTAVEPSTNDGYSRILIGAYNNVSSCKFGSPCMMSINTGAFNAMGITNSEDLLFPISTAAWTAGGSTSITHYILTTTSGTLIGYGALSTPISVTAANQVVGFPKNSLMICVTDNDTEITSFAKITTT